MKKKFNNYLYNLRTNEKFYLSDYSIYLNVTLDNSFITFNEGKGNGKPIELIVDISDYIDIGRVKVIENIKDEIVVQSNYSLNIEDIELCELYKSKESFYQIVKINNGDLTNSIYQLWKYYNNKYEKIYDDCLYMYSTERNSKVYLYCNNTVYKIDGTIITELCTMQADKMFLSNNKDYLCILSNSGEIKIFDENDNCIVDTNIYTNELLKKYESSTLQIGECYSMKYDKNIFITIKSNELLADVINIDLLDRKVLSTGFELNCMYDNYYINPITGIMLYQTGPSILLLTEYNYYKLSRENKNRSFIAINLINMNRVEIDNGDSCFYTFDISAYNEALTYYKNSEMKTHYFDNDFMND